MKPTPIATTERRTSFWLLLADRYRVLAEKEPGRAAYWLELAARAEQTAIS